MKKTDICNYDNKQIFLISTINERNKTITKCEYLADSIDKGNTWYLGNDYLDKKPIIKIDLNSDNNNHTVSYILKCGNIKNYKIDYEKSYLNYKYNNGTLETILFIETSYACRKVEYFIISEFIDFNYWIFMIFGFCYLFYAFIGVFTPILLQYILIFKLITIIIIFFIHFFLPNNFKFWKLWLIFISSIIISVILTNIIYNNLPKKKRKFITSIFAGFILGQLFFSLFGIFIPWNSIFLYILFLFTFIIGLIILTIFIKNKMIIFIINSVIVSYLLIRYISLSNYFKLFNN